MENIITKEVQETRWLQELRTQCKLTSQSKVAKTLGYSVAVINQVLKGTYKGDLKKVEQKVRGAFLGETVGCPILGELERNKCIEHQTAKYSSVNRLRVQLFKACPNCDYNTTHELEETEVCA
ncbi:MAG: helix-turn-helix transcriptional regulator [Oceanospirillaceae bacterium]|nr:helix-turn-helix transcriptional regulator [Oceanospirillaceae bacterium]